MHKIHFVNEIMKYLIFFSLAFLLFLSSEVSSQNPNMLEFNLLSCQDPNSPACDAMNIYQQAGQIISDNLVLTKTIKVSITVANINEENFYGSYAFQLTFIIIKLLLIYVFTSKCINSFCFPTSSNGGWPQWWSSNAIPYSAIKTSNS